MPTARSDLVLRDSIASMTESKESMLFTVIVFGQESGDSEKLFKKCDNQVSACWPTATTDTDKSKEYMSMSICCRHFEMEGSHNAGSPSGRMKSRP